MTSVLVSQLYYQFSHFRAKLYDYIKEIRKSQDKISRLTYEVNWSQHISYYTVFNRILEWTEECWKTLYFLYPFEIINFSSQKYPFEWLCVIEFKIIIEK